MLGQPKLMLCAKPSKSNLMKMKTCDLAHIEGTDHTQLVAGTN
jgi:hypothetical protein